MSFGNYIANIINGSVSSVPLEGEWADVASANMAWMALIIDLCVIFILISIAVVIFKAIRG